MRISKRTGYKFADFCSDYSTLHPIQALFEAEDFVPKPGYDGPEGGQRRFLVGSFHANIDLDDPAQQHRLLLVYLEAIDSWGRTLTTGELTAEAIALIRSLKRDGAPIDDEGNLTATPVAAILPLDGFSRLSEPRVLQQHLDRIGKNLTDDPAAAIGSSKELARQALVPHDVWQLARARMATGLRDGRDRNDYDDQGQRQDQALLRGGDPI